MVESITNDNFEKEVINSNKTVLIDFYADWCGPCKLMSPIVDEISEELADTLKVGKVNVDDNIELAEKFEIMSIPTLLIFKNGEMANKIIGAVSKDEILKAIND